MKKKEKKERGITLVALVVTIIVLLILAGTTIATIFGENGIIKMAQKAKDETEKAQEETDKQLQNLMNELSNVIENETEKTTEWTQPDPLKPEITNGEITLKIGDYVDYDCTTSDATYTSTKEKTGHTEDQVFKAKEYQYGWRVLGVDENKQLMLLSEDFAQPIEGGTTLGVRQAYNLKGQEGYANGVNELNNICSIYGNGKGAISARCIKVDDVNKITGYNPNNTGVKDPMQTGSGRKYQEGQAYEYGNKIKYTLLSTGVKYEPSNGATSGTNTVNKSFEYYDEVSKSWKNLKIGESLTLQSNYYSYYSTTLTTTNDKTSTIGIGTETQEYKMLFKNSSTGLDTSNAGKTDNVNYWLSSSCVYTSNGSADFGIGNVMQGYTGSILYFTNGLFYGVNLGVRPLVTITSKAKLKDSGTMQDGCKLYNLILEQQ